MAAHEDQTELVLRCCLHDVLGDLRRKVRREDGCRVVGEVVALRRSRRTDLAHRRDLLSVPDGLSAHPIARLVPCGGDQPGPRIRRLARGGPLHERGEACLLGGVLRGRQVTGQPGDTGDHGPPVLAHGTLDQDTRFPAAVEVVGAWVAMTARTSTDPVAAAGIIAAYISASSRSAQSTRVYPPP